jgi:pimeloyl-ACP methyl ester carboxylesterase
MIVAIVVVVAVVAAVVGASSLIAYTKSPAVIEQQYVQPIDWESCGKPIQCAEIPVPLDWSTASSKRIYINVARHRATGTKLGSIVTDPGGPGGTGSGFVGNDVRGAVTKQIEEHYDVIGIDPRGVGGSEPIECGSSTVLDDYLYGIVPGQVGSSSWITATERAASTYAQACRTHSSEMIDHVDTVDAAMDMDLIRADLGESRLNYLGYSYGTELGSVYASIFPKRVGRFVLDGVVDIWNSPKSDPTVGQAAAFEGDLRAWMTACLAKSSTAVPSGKSCPFTGTTAEGMAAIRALLAHATTTPYVDTNGRELGAAQLATGISGDLYSEDEWPELTALFSGLKVGDPTEALRSADSYYEREKSGKYVDDGNSDEAFNAISCADSGSQQRSVASMRKQAAALEKAAPTIGRYWAYGDILCNEWHAADHAFPGPPTGAGMDKVLVVGTTGDPATPYSDAKALAKTMPTAHLLTFDGEGHTAYDKGDTCVDSAVDAYLMHGTVPSAAASFCS